jgi:hypothetical protein
MNAFKPKIFKILNGQNNIVCALERCCFQALCQHDSTGIAAIGAQPPRSDEPGRELPCEKTSLPASIGDFLWYSYGM